MITKTQYCRPLKFGLGEDMIAKKLWIGLKAKYIMMIEVASVTASWQGFVN